MLDCEHPAREPGERIVDADEVLNCAEFETVLGIEGLRARPGFAVLRTALVATAVTLVAMFGFVRLYGGRSQASPPVLLRTSVAVKPVIFQESGVDIKVLVLNEADYPAREVTVFISGRSMAHLTCQYVRPAEAFVEATPQLSCALVGDLASGEIGSVEFHFICGRPGELELTAHVTAANLEGPRSLPIDCEVVP